MNVTLLCGCKNTERQANAQIGRDWNSTVFRGSTEIFLVKVMFMLVLGCFRMIIKRNIGSQQISSRPCLSL